jgi:hypothetical protein
MRSSIAVIGLLCIAWCIGQAFAANDTNAPLIEPNGTTLTLSGRTYDLSDMMRTYRFPVTITVSKPKNVTYVTGYTRTGTFLNLTITRPLPARNLTREVATDIPIPDVPTRLDPRTCPDNIAFCYQVLERIVNKNGTGFSNYTMPEVRARQFFCVGDDTECVASARHCYCPSDRLPLYKTTFKNVTACVSLSNLCTDNLGTFHTCSKAYEECSKEHASCTCGPSTICPAKNHVCLDLNHKMLVCRGTLADCAKTYPHCFCGTDLLTLQQGCTTTRHTCQRGSVVETCSGTFTECALKYDKCEC